MTREQRYKEALEDRAVEDRVCVIVGAVCLFAVMLERVLS